MSLINTIISKYTRVVDPISYWKKQGLSIGNNCEVYYSASFGSEPYLVSIGNHVRINANVTFVTHDGGVWVLREYLTCQDSDKIDIFKPIHVGNNVHIGTGATIMPGVTLGDNVIIGCNAVVTKSIPNNSIAVGVPARVIETIDEYAEKNKINFTYTKHMSANEKKSYLMKKYSRQ